MVFGALRKILPPQGITGTGNAKKFLGVPVQDIAEILESKAIPSGAATFQQFAIRRKGSELFAMGSVTIRKNDSVFRNREIHPLLTREEAHKSLGLPAETVKKSWKTWMAAKALPFVESAEKALEQPLDSLSSWAESVCFLLRGEHDLLVSGLLLEKETGIATFLQAVRLPDGKYQLYEVAEKDEYGSSFTSSVINGTRWARSELFPLFSAYEAHTSRILLPPPDSLKQSHWREALPGFPSPDVNNAKRALLSDPLLQGKVEIARGYDTSAPSPKERPAFISTFLAQSRRGLETALAL